MIKSYKRYILQSLLMFICMSVVLFLNQLFSDLIIASFGASGFIILALPKVSGSRTRNVIGGYICGVLAGALLAFFGTVLLPGSIGTIYGTVFMCAGAAALAMFLMAVTNRPHPPAAALAIGLVVDPRFIRTGILAVAGVTILCGIRYCLRDYIDDLV